MKKAIIIYGSTTENTKEAAGMIAAQLKEFSPAVKDVSECTPEDFTENDFLFLGTSTWGAGDLQDDWYDMLPKLSSADLTGKTVALFGLGDSYSYSDTFVGGMRELYDFFSGKGCRMEGAVSTAGYNFEDSAAIESDEFVGLPLDADNESDQSEERIANWLKALKPLL